MLKDTRVHQKHITQKNPRGSYRQQFYQAVDVLIFSVRDHSDQTSFLVFEQLEALLLKALKGEDTSCELDFVREKYSDDVNVNDLIVELNIFKILVKDKDIEHFHDIIKEIKLIDNAERKLIVNICAMCKMLPVNLASSSTAERRFSTARRVKTWMRSTMLPARFNSVVMLNFNKKRLD